VAKKQKYTTPAGIAVYPHLNKPDTRAFKGKAVKPAWKVKLRLIGGEAEDFKEKIDSMVEVAYQEAVDEAKPKDKKKIERAYPYEEEYGDDDEPTGALIFNFKQNAVIPGRDGAPDTPVTIPLFNCATPAKLVMGAKVGGGSTIRVSFTSRNYMMSSSMKAGITLDLAAVKIIDLVEFGVGTADSYGFGEEDEGFDSEPEETPASATSNAQEDNGEDDF